ncbi:MAG: hypothetical protein ABEJ93_01350 [Candidatus Nanohalobium sp.]
MSDEYKDLIEIAVKKEINTMGKPIALRQAKKASGLKLDEDGNVEELEEPGEKVLEEVLEKFEEATGPVAVAVISTAIKQEKDEINIDLPEDLEEEMN